MNAYKSSAPDRNVRRMRRGNRNISALCMFIFLYYAQPKTVFIHTFHRVIHSFSREKWRKNALSTGFIHIIHRFSTGFIPNDFICGYACGHA